MSAKEVTIGIDIGTTAVKAVAADSDGRVVSRTRIPHPLRIPTPDRMEHDADVAWRQGPLRALRELDRPDARAVAVSAMAPSLTAVDHAGEPISPGLLYGDSRGRTPQGTARHGLGSGEGTRDGPGSGEATRDGPGIGDAGEQGPGLGEAAEFLRWTARERPDAAGYWPAPAVANFALAGDAVVDRATASMTFPLFNGTGWNPDALADSAVGVDQMPRVEMIGAAAGPVHGMDAVLAVGAIDALCEQLVAGADQDGDVLVLCGTTLIVWANIAEFRQVPGLWTIPHLVSGKSQIGGASNAGGLFLRWADRLVGPGDPAAAEPHRVPVWSPYVRGERTPFHDPDRRAVLDALDLTHEAASVRRAAYEASAFVVRQLIELCETPVSRIVAAGGGTRVQAWMQAIADAVGQPVEVSGVAEGAALGAAFLGRVAAGLESSMAAAARWATIAHVVEPDPAWTDAMKDRYGRFLELAGRPSRPLTAPDPARPGCAVASPLRTRPRAGA